MPRMSENALSPRPVAVVARMAAEEGRRLLGQCTLFRELGREERDALFARIHVRAYCAGETIFHMRSAGDSMMAVLSGSVRISVPSPDGREIVLAILQSGEVFGEIALLDGKERTADASAVTACHLAILDRRDVLAFLDRHPKMWPRLAELLCGRLRSSDERVAGLALQQLPTRLAKTLLRFASTKPEATSRQLQVQLSQRELGNICGATARPSTNA